MTRADRAKLWQATKVANVVNSSLLPVTGNSFNNAEIEDVEADMVDALINHENNLQPAQKPWSPRTVRAVERERAKWIRFCKAARLDPDEAIMANNIRILKGYLRWRIEVGRIKKLSTLKSYWDRLSGVYQVVAQGWMDGKILYEINNVSYV